MYYNADMFTEAGLKTPAELAKDGKWDWAAFENAAKKLTDEKAGIYGYSDGGWWGLTGFWINSGGGSWFNKDKTACALNTPEAAKGIQFLADMFNKSKVAPLPVHRLAAKIHSSLAKPVCLRMGAGLPRRSHASQV
jgi:multiple sugar transport system substrate-binding protein